MCLKSLCIDTLFVQRNSDEEKDTRGADRNDLDFNTLINVLDGAQTPRGLVDREQIAA